MRKHLVASLIYGGSLGAGRHLYFIDTEFVSVFNSGDIQNPEISCRNPGLIAVFQASLVLEAQWAASSSATR